MAQLLPQVKYYPPKLDRLFIFNPKFGPKEGEEHKKILFYWPSSHPLESQLADIGLSEALTNVTKTFTQLPVETLRTDKCRWTFLNPEGEYWMCLVAKNARVIKKEGQPAEYLEEDINDLALAQVLKRVYSYFKLLHGPLENIALAHKDLEKLKTTLKLALAPIVTHITGEDVDIFSALDAIQFLGVNKNVYLQIQSFINTTENAFEQIVSSAFLYRDALVWSGLEQDDMRFLYKFLGDLKKQGKLNRAGFIYGPEDLKKENSPITTLPIYIGTAKPIRHELVLFHLQDMICVYVVAANTTLKGSFFSQLADFIVPQLTFLSPILSGSMAPRREDDPYRYVYFNQMNLAIKTTIRSKMQELSREVLALIGQMHQDFERSTEIITETTIRTIDDIWVVGKRSDQREFYIIFDQQGSNLLDVNDEVKKLSASLFNSIFID